MPISDPPFSLLYQYLPQKCLAIYNELMVNIIAIILLVFSIGQIGLATLVLIGKFDPLLPKERNNLPAKVRKKARLLNAAAMIATSVIICIISAGLLLSQDMLLTVAAALFAITTIVILVLGTKLEGKYLKP